jgi:hypothetical protein
MEIRTDTGELRVAEGGLLALPNAQEPVACGYQDPAGAWVCERAVGHGPKSAARRPRLQDGWARGLIVDGPARYFTSSPSAARRVRLS